MKTNVILKSSDRDLFGIKVRQNTKGEMLSITDLQKSYDKARWMYGWSDRRINDIISGKDFRERLYHLLKERDMVKTDISAFIEMYKKEGAVKTMKGLGVWKTTGRHENRSVMCDPYIWVLVAMEMNPMLYAKVVIWLTDTLVFDRIEAGDEFKPMNAAIKSIIPKPDYATYARLINEKVFGHHQRGMRDLASSAELRKVAEIEKFVTNGIEMGMIKNKEQLIYVLKNHK